MQTDYHRYYKVPLYIWNIQYNFAPSYIVYKSLHDQILICTIESDPTQSAAIVTWINILLNKWKSCEIVSKMEKRDYRLNTRVP